MSTAPFLYRTRLLAPTALGLLLLGSVVGCTGDPHTGTDTVGRIPSAAAPTKSTGPSTVGGPVSMADLAAQIGCEKIIPEKIVISTEAGRCTLPSGHIAYLRVFTDNNFRDQYIQLITHGPSVSYATGESWVVFGHPLTDNELALLDSTDPA